MVGSPTLRSVLPKTLPAPEFVYTAVNEELSVDKTASRREINGLRTLRSSQTERRYAVLQPSVCGRIRSCDPGCTPSLLPHASRHRPGDILPATPGRRAQAQATPAALELFRPALLDRPAPHLVPLDRRPRHRETIDRRRLAPRGFSAVLALAVLLARWSAEDHRGDSHSDPTHGGRECRLGRSQDSRRTFEARL